LAGTTRRAIRVAETAPLHVKLERAGKGAPPALSRGFPECTNRKLGDLGESGKMSGPIIRKYGFPNFDKIFGERPLQHGVEEEETQETATESADAKPAKTKAKSAAKPGASRTKKS
jgi:hypothetical protein